MLHHRISIAWLSLSLSLGACVATDETEDSPSDDEATSEQSDALAISIPNYQEHVVPACSLLGSGSESCVWVHQFAPAACPSGRCSKLVIYFSGGQFTCPAQDQASSYLRHYADRGYLAVCARLYETPGGSATFSYGTETSRADLLVRRITADPVVRSRWTGEDLLISGVSHGASVPVVAMARSDVETATAWKGSRKTGACFFDGIYDFKAQASLLYDNACGNVPGLQPLTYEKAYSRYCGWTGGTYKPSWPRPETCDNVRTRNDSITTVSPSAFAIRDWKLIECGSGVSATCVGDMTPAAPIRALCTNLASDPQHRCTFESFPSVWHESCAISSTTIDRCRSWFDAL